MIDEERNDKERKEHQAKVMTAAVAAVDATALILKKTEADFLFALDTYKNAIKAHAHAETTLDYVRIDQQGGVE